MSTSILIDATVFPIGRIPDSTPTSALLKVKVDSVLSVRHSTEKVLRCWGMGAGAGAQETKEAIQNLLTEYSSSFDMEEASRYGLGWDTDPVRGC